MPRGGGGDRYRLRAVNDGIVNSGDRESRRRCLTGGNDDRCGHGRLAHIIAGQRHRQGVGGVGIAADRGGGRATVFRDLAGDNGDRQSCGVIIGDVNGVCSVRMPRGGGGDRYRLRGVDDGVVDSGDRESRRRRLTGGNDDRGGHGRLACIVAGQRHRQGIGGVGIAADGGGRRAAAFRNCYSQDCDR